MTDPFIGIAEIVGYFKSIQQNTIVAIITWYEMDLLCPQISTWMGSSQGAKLPGGKDTFPYLYFT